MSSRFVVGFVDNEDAPRAGGRRREAGSKRARREEVADPTLEDEEAPGGDDGGGAGAGDGAGDEYGQEQLGGDEDLDDDAFGDLRTPSENLKITAEIRSIARMRKSEKRTQKNRRLWSEEETDLLWKLHAIAFSRGIEGVAAPSTCRPPRPLPTLRPLP